jgi:hypothetical protein
MNADIHLSLFALIQVVRSVGSHCLFLLPIPEIHAHWFNVNTESAEYFKHFAQFGIMFSQCHLLISDICFQLVQTRCHSSCAEMYWELNLAQTAF